jgi:hypothetical protein
MVWIVGTRERKEKRVEQGPVPYTLAVLSQFAALCDSLILRDKRRQQAYLEAAKLLKARDARYRTHPGSIGMIWNEDQAVRAICNFIERETDWTDLAIKTKGKSVFESFVRANIRDIVTAIGFTGNTEAFVEHLMWRARKEFGW